MYLLYYYAAVCMVNKDFQKRKENPASVSTEVLLWRYYWGTQPNSKQFPEKSTD